MDPPPGFVRVGHRAKLRKLAIDYPRCRGACLRAYDWRSRSRSATSSAASPSGMPVSISPRRSAASAQASASGSGGGA